MIINEKIVSTLGIYLITNLVNNKVYVGSSVDLLKRYKEHEYYLKKNKHHNMHLQRAWDKYGENNFSFSILEIVFEKNELIEREQYWMDFYNVSEKGYNINPVAGSNLGRKNPEDDLEKFMYSQKNNRPILQIDFNGNIVREWYSLGEIAKILNVGITIVKSRLVGNKFNMISDDSFLFFKDEYTEEKLQECINNKNKSKKDKEVKMDKEHKLLQFDMDGNLIRKWYSITEASETLNITKHIIKTSCKNGSPVTTGFIWKYVEQEEIQ